MSELSDFGLAGVGSVKDVLRRLNDKKARRNLVICGKLAEVRNLLQHRANADGGLSPVRDEQAHTGGLDDAACLAGGARQQPVGRHDIGEDDLLKSIDLLTELLEFVLQLHGYGHPSLTDELHPSEALAPAHCPSGAAK